MLDTSVSMSDMNRLFNTGVVTYCMPSGKSYMRTIGKQAIESSIENDKDRKVHENIPADKNLVQDQQTQTD